jgi:hypothetical protein
VCPSERSFRYPWPIDSPEKLEQEMRRAEWNHGRVHLCGWKLMWLKPPRVVMWDEAAKIVEDWQARQGQKT